MDVSLLSPLLANLCFSKFSVTCLSYQLLHFLSPHLIHSFLNWGQCRGCFWIIYSAFFPANPSIQPPPPLQAYHFLEPKSQHRKRARGKAQALQMQIPTGSRQVTGVCEWARWQTGKYMPNEREQLLLSSPAWCQVGVWPSTARGLGL